MNNRFGNMRHWRGRKPRLSTRQRWRGELAAYNKVCRALEPKWF